MKWLRVEEHGFEDRRRVTGPAARRPDRERDRLELDQDPVGHGIDHVPALAPALPALDDTGGACGSGRRRT
jgi:hypothetical protein